MALSNKRLTIIAESVVDDEKIASYGAILDLNNLELSLSNRHIDKEACKTHRDIVRADQAEFEDYAYMIQDQLKSMTEE